MKGKYGFEPSTLTPEERKQFYGISCVDNPKYYEEFEDEEQEYTEVDDTESEDTDEAIWYYK